MKYVFDTSSFRELERFYPNVFKSIWVKMERDDLPDHLHLWIKDKGRDNIFTIPTPEELRFVQTILSVRHFQVLIGSKQLLRGSPVADPFVIACAKVRKGTVVTEENYKPNAAKIPNVCEHFKIPCVNLEQFMREQKWEF
jgi:hypothetical protein